MKYSRLTSVSVASLLVFGWLLAGISTAAAPPTSYVGIKAGGYFPLSGDLTTFDAGFCGELAFGHYLAPGFAVEAGVGRFSTEGDHKTGAGARVSREISISSVALTLKGVAPFGGFEGYAAAGGGVYFINDELVGDPSTATRAASDDEVRIGAHAGVGGSAALSRQVFVGVDARYLLLKAHTFGDSTRLDGVTVTGSLGYRF